MDEGEGTLKSFIKYDTTQEKKNTKFIVETCVCNACTKTCIYTILFWR